VGEGGGDNICYPRRDEDIAAMMRSFSLQNTCSTIVIEIEEKEMCEVYGTHRRDKRRIQNFVSKA
jgi:hypothetical protein